MKNIVRKIIVLVFLLVLNTSQLWAQCAMCRGSVESTMGNGRNNVGIGLNVGIMYLFIMPYLIVFAVAFMWYRTSRKNREAQRLVAAQVRRAMGN